MPGKFTGTFRNNSRSFPEQNSWGGNNKKKAKNEKFAVIVNEELSAKSNAAKIYLTLVRGQSKILDLQVRYKGTFTSRPQFQGGLAKDFESILKTECGSS